MYTPLIKILDPDILSDRASRFAGESIFLSGVVMRLIEALHVAFCSEGYEDLSENERLEVGRSAIAMVPSNIEIRRPGSLNMDALLTMQEA